MQSSEPASHLSAENLPSDLCYNTHQHGTHKTTLLQGVFPSIPPEDKLETNTMDHPQLHWRLADPQSAPLLRQDSSSPQTRSTGALLRFIRSTSLTPVVNPKYSTAYFTLNQFRLLLNCALILYSKVTSTLLYINSVAT